jgi:hypothetical protein
MMRRYGQVSSITGGLLGTFSGMEWLASMQNHVKDSKYLIKIATDLVSKSEPTGLPDIPEVSRSYFNRWLDCLGSAGNGITPYFLLGSTMAIGFDIGLSTGGYEISEISEIIPFGPPTFLAVSAKISPLSTPRWITSKMGMQIPIHLPLRVGCATRFTEPVISILAALLTQFPGSLQLPVPLRKNLFLPPF